MKGYEGSDNPIRRFFLPPTIGDLIVMPGFVPDEDLSAVYPAAKLFAYMSLFEGFGPPPLSPCNVACLSSPPTPPHFRKWSGMPVSNWRRMTSKAFAGQSRGAMGMSISMLSCAKCFSWDRYIDDTVSGYHRGARTEEAAGYVRNCGREGRSPR